MIGPGNHRSTWITPDEAHAAMRGGTGRGIKIAILDSGVELSHPALQHLRLLDDLAFQATGDGVLTRTPGWGTDSVGHGTAVAQVLMRVAPEAMLGSFRVLDDRNECPAWMICHAAMDAIERGYDIINCSFGVAARSNYLGYFKPWIDAAYRRGVHVVSACNNGHFRNPEWPGVFPSVIAVNMAATDSDDVFFRWDARAGVPPVHLVEFAARGVNLELPWKDGQMVQGKSGSSFAAPHVAGALARMLSVYPGLKPPVAKALLQEVASPWEPRLGGG